MKPGSRDAKSERAIANGIVYIGSGDHNVYAFNAATGATLWSAYTYGWRSSPAVANGTLDIGSLADVWAFGLP